MSSFVCSLTVLALLAPPLAGQSPQSAKTAPPKPAGARARGAVNPSAAVLADFQKRVEAYVAVHRKQEATLPGLSKQTNPQEIDKHERALAALIQAARKTARQGDLFTPPMQRVIRNLLRPIFSGKEGAQIRDEILDREYKGSVKLVVNGRYPDDVPVSTMPPQVLAALPKLPEDLEYRFVRSSLILFDSHAHLIADFTDRAFN